MMTIWKFPVPLEPRSSIMMPPGSRVLTAQMQNGKLMLWAVVDAAVKTRDERIFSVVGTGQPELNEIDAFLTYIATVQVGGLIGTLVMHVFEINPPGNLNANQFIKFPSQ